MAEIDNDNRNFRSADHLQAGRPDVDRYMERECEKIRLASFGDRNSFRADAKAENDQASEEVA